MQFVLFRPLTTTANVVLKKLDYYGAGDGPSDYRAPQFYITIVQNVSIFVAFTGLLKFYHAVDKDLSWCRPLAKFLCIKGVVFMTFWQGLAITILAQMTDVAGEDKTEWAMSAQNFLICLEMLLFSIAHFYCFPTEEWQEGYRIKAERGQFGDTIALGDFFQDVKLILTNNNNNHKPKKRRKKSSLIGNQTISSKSILDPESGDMKDRGAKIVDVEAGEGMNDGSEDLLAVDVLIDNDIDANQVHSSIDVDSSVESVRDDDGDEDGAESTETMSEDALNDEQQYVKRALEKSLGNLGDDPDIQEATKRLLESKVLSPDFFSSSDIGNVEFQVHDLHEVDDFASARSDDGDDEEGNESSYQEEEDYEDEYSEGEQTVEQDQDDEALVALGKATRSASQDHSTDGLEGGETPDLAPGELSPLPQAESGEAQTPGRAYEQKGLEFLKPSRESVGDKIRPSIFTTIAQMEEKQQEQISQDDEDEEECERSTKDL